MLGQPSSGKSTLVSALLHKALSDDQTPKELISLLVTIFADVRGKADEGKYSRFQATSKSMLRVLDSLARLSVYTVPSSKSSYTALLPHFLPPRS